MSTIEARFEGSSHARGLSPLKVPASEEMTLDQALQQIRHLERALETNRDIGAAVGIVMSTCKLTKDEAFDALRRVSQQHNRKLSLVAEQVLLTGVLPEDGRWY